MRHGQRGARTKENHDDGVDALLPGTYCAAPAVLTAISAYLRGDDLRARVALDTARRASPTYRFAALLDRALDLGVPRADLASMVNHVTTAGDAADEPSWP